MTFNPNLPVQVDSGRPVRILCTDRAGQYPIVALITQDNGGETVHNYSADGRYSDSSWSPNLRNAPSRKFINIWETKRGTIACSPQPFGSRDEAIKSAVPPSRHLMIALELSGGEL